MSEHDWGKCPDCGHPLDIWFQNDCRVCLWEAAR